MAITLQDALQRTIEHREIFHDEMLALMRTIMSGEATPVMIAALTCASCSTMRSTSTKPRRSHPKRS